MVENAQQLPVKRKIKHERSQIYILHTDISMCTKAACVKSVLNSMNNGPMPCHVLV